MTHVKLEFKTIKKRYKKPDKLFIGDESQRFATFMSSLLT